jgi:predicted ester cyclase/predicted enzyme related to lactoylglutathione lyase
VLQAESEVWEAVRELNRTWTGGNVEDLARHLHPEVVAVTPADPDPLHGREAVMAAWRRFSDATTIRGWRELDPRVRVFGDAAVVSYRYELDGRIGERDVTLSGRDLFFMVREGGRWVAAGDQFSPYPRATEATSIEQVARRWMALWQEGGLAGFDDLHDPEFVDHDPACRTADREGFRRGIEELLTAFPDFQAEVGDLVADVTAGRVAVRWSATGTHRAPFLGRGPTGAKVSFSGIEVIRVAGGRVAERWGEWNGEAILAEIDAAAVTPHHDLTILAVADVERSARFYRGAFGWPTRVEVPAYVELEQGKGRALGLYLREGFARNTGLAPRAVPSGAISGTEIYLRCPDLDTAIARIEEAGARRLSPRAAKDWGDEAAYYADPDGNVVVVARPLASPGT